MKAIVVEQFGGPEVMNIKEVQVPQPGFKEILVRNHAAGVNPVDTYIRAGHFRIPPYDKLPLTPGIDGAGIIEAVGPGVTKFKKGERVFIFTTGQGLYAQYAVVPEAHVFRLPGSLSFQQGAAVGVPYFTAYRALFQTGKTKSHKIVLVHGASGGVGIASVQMAKEAGMTVYGTAGTEAGLKLVKENGADHVFNHRDKSYLEEMKKTLDGQTFDIIVETNADINLQKDIEMVSKKGIIALIGARGTVEINPSMVMGTEARMVGVLVLSMAPEELSEAGIYIVRGLSNGHLVPIVDKEYPLEEAARSHKEIIESSGAKGKLILVIN